MTADALIEPTGAAVRATVLFCKALPLDRLSVPPLMVVMPERVFAPPKVKTPLPTLVKLPVPLITPEYV